MKNQMITPTLASREFVALPCATDVPATDRRSIAGRRAVWGTDVRGIDAMRVRTTGEHAGFAQCTGSLTWSPPI